MDKIPNLALIAQMLDSAEKSIQSAKQMLKDSISGTSAFGSLKSSPASSLSEKAVALSVSEGGKVIEGVFDGQNMIGPDKKQYPVPANYASKSKLVEGDVLKLTIAEDGSFIYKQIGPVDRKKMLGILLLDEKGDFKVIAEGKTFKVLLASLTYYKAEEGDEVTVVVPTEGQPEWAAVDNVIKKGAHSRRDNSDIEMGIEEVSSRLVSDDEDL